MTFSPVASHHADVLQTGPVVTEHDSQGRQILGRSDRVARPITGRGRASASSGANTRDDAVGPMRSGSAGPGEQGRSRRRSRRRRPRIRTVIGLLAVIAVMTPIALLAFGWWQFSRIPTVDVSSVLSPRAGRKGTNYLIVGTDSRAGIDSSDPNSGAFIASEVSGARTDTIMVLHVEGSTTTLTSVPRDLWVTDPANGQKGRINSTFASGPANLVKSVESLGIPVDHYLEINFVSFSRLVDAVGGISIDFATPVRDTHSGLSIDTPGRHRLDGSTALAYVRSRYYEEYVDGRWRTDPTSDLGRTERQRAFLSALMKEATHTIDPFALFRLPGALGSGLRRDITLSFFDAADLAWTMKDSTPEAIAIPVTPRTTSGGAAILELKTDSSEVIAQLSH